MHPSKDMKMRKFTKEMDNGEAVEVVEAAEEEEVIPIISTMKIKVTCHSKVMVMVNEEAGDVEPIKVQMKCGMINLKLSVITVIKWDITLGNVVVMLKRKFILLTTTKLKMCQHWYLENGASNHMCGHKDKFVEIKKVVKDNVSFGDISKIQIEGIGTILTSCKDGGHKFITNFYYGPKLKVIF